MSTQREVFEAGVLFVGGGAANLVGAIRLAQLIQEHNALVESGKKSGKVIDTEGELPILVIEKSSDFGDHSLSGAVFNPVVLDEVLPEWRAEAKFPRQAVSGDEVLYLTAGGKHFTFPVTPPTFHNEGNFILSLGRLNKWLSEKAESLGINVFAGFPGAETLFDDNNAVTGVRCGDKGIDKHGKRKGNFEAGMDITAKVTVFGEGPRGSLTKQLVPKLGLAKGKNPQVYSTGVKELWEVPAGRLKGGRVIHTMGYPMIGDEFGGSFMYELDSTHLIIGMVSALSAADPFLDPHRKLQMLKTHPFVRNLIEGGKMISYGAKTIPEGGWYSCPKNAFDGGLLVGDSAGFVNVPKLKGIHYAMMSGKLAAETIFEALVSEDYSEKTLSRYSKRVDESFIGNDLREFSRFRQGFEKGMLFGMVNAGMITATKGMLSIAPKHILADYQYMKPMREFYKDGRKAPDDFKFDGTYTFNKLDDVYLSGTTHEEDQPCHLVIQDYDICNTKCKEEYGNPCQYFCPAAVYEMVPDEKGETSLHVNFSNCVHCKTCDIRDPYQIINWVTPEGGDGPKYQDL